MENSNANNNQGISAAMSLMSAPIPGQSLTRSPGSRPYEQPPKYTKEDDALYAILNSVTDKQSGAAIGVALERGLYASDIANTVLMAGVAQGKWTPDLAALIAKRTLGAVVAVGKAQGVENMRYMKPTEDSTMESILNLPKLINQPEKLNKEITTKVEDTVVQQVEEPKLSIKGIMGEEE